MYVDFRVVGQSREGVVERFVHFFGRAFEEASAAWEEMCELRVVFGCSAWRNAVRTSDEQRIAREDCPVVTVLEKEADAVLGMAGRVQCLHLDPADVEGLAMAGRFGEFGAISAADDGDGEGLELARLVSVETVSDEIFG